MAAFSHWGTQGGERRVSDLVSHEVQDFWEFGQLLAFIGPAIQQLYNIVAGKTSEQARESNHEW